MGDVLDLAAANLLSPAVLFFALGVGAALARSDLDLPQPVAKALALYLMLAIGFKGGAGVAAHGVDPGLILTILAGVVLSFALPLIAFALLRATTKLPPIDAAAVAAHYGSISVVTFAVCVEAVESLGLAYEGYMVAVAAAMETPAILSGLDLAYRHADPASEGQPRGELFREVALNGSIIVLLGAFAIGWITGGAGMAKMAPLIESPFQGVLALFLLDMGVIAGRGLRQGAREIGPPVAAFGLYMPLIGAGLGALAAWALGLSPGGAALFITLCASASYIAVPAAMRLALPEARPAIFLTLSLGVTFPFNLTLGIPLYIAMAEWLAG